VRRLWVALSLILLVAAVGLVSGCIDSSEKAAQTPADAPTVINSAKQTDSSGKTITAPASTAPAGGGGSTTAPASTAPTTKTGSTVAVAADPSGALAYVQKTLTAPAGSDTFQFTNDSPVPHNLTFEKAGTANQLGATKTFASGSASLTLTLAKGTYSYYCSVPGHEAAGMKGTLTVQ
jgi:plastocyanin